MISNYQSICDDDIERQCFQARAEYMRCLQSYVESTKQFFLEVKSEAKKLSKLSVTFNTLQK